MKTMLLALMLLPSVSFASLVGKLNLQPSVQPIIARELHDGQWLAGISHPDIWALVYHGAGNLLYSDGDQVFHAGLFTAWNAEKGNASYGPLAGVNIPLKIGSLLQSMGDNLGLSTTFKPISFAGSYLSIDGFGGVRPFHTSDVIGNWVYGFLFQVKIPFAIDRKSVV